MCGFQKKIHAHPKIPRGRGLKASYEVRSKLGMEGGGGVGEWEIKPNMLLWKVRDIFWNNAMATSAHISSKTNFTMNEDFKRIK